MNFHFFSSLRFRLILLVLLAVIPAMGITLYRGFEERKLAIEHIKQSQLRLAKLISHNFDHLIENTRHLLHGLAQLPQLHHYESASTSQIFANILKQHPWLLNIGAADAKGDIFASAVPMAKSINIADRSYFQLALRNRKFSLGDFQVGRIVNKPVINFGYPVIDEEGKIKSIIFTALDLSWLNKLVESVNLPSGSTLWLINHNGIILAHYPETEKWVSKTLTDQPIIKEILEQKQGTIEAEGIDGQERFYSFTSFSGHLSAGNIYLAIGLPKSIVFAEIERIERRNILLISIIGLLSILTAIVFGNIFFHKRLKALVEATQKLKSGDLSSRVKIGRTNDEINHLASAFNEMAASLEEREIERKKAEETLRVSERKFRELANLLPGIVFEVDEKGNLTFASQKAYELMGYSSEDFEEDLNIFQFLAPEEIERGKEIFIKAQQEEKNNLIFNLIKKDGSKFPALIHSQPAMRDGVSLGVRGLAVDITELKRKEENLKEKEEEARKLANENEVVAEIGKIISSSLNIEEVYEGFAKEVSKLIPFDKISINIVDLERNTVTLPYVTGKPVSERNSKDVFSLRGSFTEAVVKKMEGIIFHPVNEEEVAALFPKLLPVYRAGLKSIMAVPLFLKGKPIGTLHFNSESPGAYSEKYLQLAERVANQIAGAIANAQLFAEHERMEKERLALEEQFRQAQKMEAVGRLASGIAHDFNNSLTLIKVAGQLALMDIKDSDPIREKINLMLESTDHSANLSRQLLAFSRKQVMEMKVIDLNLVIKELDKMLHRVIGEDIELAYQLAEDLRKVKVDPVQMEQVILNLSLNSRDAMPQGGKLIIETANVQLDEEYARTHVGSKPGQYVLLAVTDTGIGMTPEVKEHIFEPFFTTKAKGKGTGLGLSSVYGIVKQSGGSIWVYSEPGQGTTFKIYLPVIDEPAEKIKREAETTIPSGNETILVVEDEEEVRKLAVNVLERLGYRILVAASGQEAMKIGESFQESVHLLLTDVIMPGMNGMELAHTLSHLHPEIKVLFMSGYPDEIISDFGILKPGVNYIQKPFTLESLAKKVREALSS